MFYKGYVDSQWHLLNIRFKILSIKWKNHMSKGTPIPFSVSNRTMSASASILL
jgi:hypothetical protein